MKVPAGLVVTPAVPMPGFQPSVTGALAGKPEPLTATTVPGGPTFGSRLIFGVGDPGDAVGVGVGVTGDGDTEVGVFGIVTRRVVFASGPPRRVIVWPVKIVLGGEVDTEVPAQSVSVSEIE